MRHVLVLCAGVLAGLGALALAGCGDDHDHSKHSHGPPAEKAPAAPEAADPHVKPYPLKTCVVSGEPLESMGKPARIVLEGQEIKLCCGGCEKDFRKDPATFMRKIAEAEKK